MTACLAMPVIGLIYDAVPGMSEESYTLQRNYHTSLDHFFEPRRELIFEIDDAVLGSLTEDFPVDEETAGTAKVFASLLPRSFPRPEVSSDPDGELSFDWMGPSEKMFSVSVNKSGRLAYAGMFGENSKVHGIEQLVESVPQEILRNVWRATR